MRKYYHCFPSDGNVMSVEVEGTNHFMTIEISDADGEHEPKSIKIDRKTLSRLANELKLISELM